MPKYLVVVCVVALALACDRNEETTPAAASEDDNMRLDDNDRRPTTPITPSGEPIPQGLPKQPAAPIQAADDVTEPRPIPDIDPDQLTPEQRRDREITQRIQQNVEAHNALSLSAKDVKVTTMDGRVTLAGEVETAEERRIVERIALEAAGPAKVDNKLTIDEAP